MAFPLTQAPVTVEIAPGADPMDQDTWSFIDITSYVRTEDGISLGYGRRDEGATVDTSTCDIRLDNTDGRFSPRNAEGPYFGQLSRNTPLRVRWPVDNDDFSTNSTNNWGTSDNGVTWSSLASGGSNFTTDRQVTGGEASHLLSAGSAYRVNYLNGMSARDVDVTTTVRTSVTTVAGGAIEIGGIVLRYQGTIDYYYCHMSVAVGGAISAKIMHLDNNLAFNLASASTGLTYSSSTSYKVRAAVVGALLRMKVWRSTDPEPAAWTCSVIDRGITLPGPVGVRDGVAAGNSNLPWTAYHADFKAVTDRFVGFVSEWPPRWDLAVVDKTVPVSATGILRRLQQRNKPLESALRKRIPSFNPKAYWPLEDGPGTTLAGSAVSGVRPLTVKGFDFESDDSLAGSKSLPSIGPGSFYSGKVPAWSGATEWQVEFVLFMAEATTTNRLIFVNTNGTAKRMEIQVTASALTVSGFDEDDATVFAHASTPTSFFGTWSRLALFAKTVAGTTTWSVRWFPIGSDGFIYTDTFPGQCGAVTGISLSQRGSGADDLIIGHIAVLDTYDSTAFTFSDAGWIGEHASARLDRLLAEESVPFIDYGDWNTTEPMGPQTVATLLDLVYETETVDAGIVHELNGGLAYLPKDSMYNQPVSMALSIANGDLGASPEPTDDDQIIVNDVTVSRAGGSMVRSADAASIARDGSYSTEIDANALYDDQLDDIAGWALHLGTVDEMRWPSITLNLAETPELIQTWQNVRIANRFTVDQDLLPGVSVDLLAVGWSETITPYGYMVEINAVPASAWTVGTLDDDVLGKLDTDGSDLHSAATSTATSLSVDVNAGPLWTTSAGEFPFDITVGGEVMTVTNITGASSPQTFTVTRSVNSVVKAQTAGTAVNLAQPLVLAL